VASIVNVIMILETMLLDREKVWTAFKWHTLHLWDVTPRTFVVGCRRFGNQLPT
jgi:hypothetical protein